MESMSREAFRIRERLRNFFGVLGRIMTAKAGRRSLQSVFAFAIVLTLVLVLTWTGKAATNSPFDQAAIDNAMSAPMVAFGADSSGSHGDTPAVVHSAA